MHFARRAARVAAVLLLALLPSACRDPHFSMNPPPPIALLTDFGIQDPYLAQMKGAILQACPGAVLVDLSHDQTAFDVKQAAWFLEKSVRYLPENAIVVAVVDPGVGGDRLPVALRTQTGRTYIGPDNGIFSAVVSREKLVEAREITNSALFRPGEVSSTFHGRDIFGPVAGRLAAGARFEEVGPVLKKLLVLPLPTASAVGDRVSGQVMHIDRFGNVLTNIEAHHLGELEKNALVKLTLGTRVLSLPLVPTYADAPDKRPFLLLNSDGELEIALKEGSAAAALKAEAGQRVVVQR
jgi:S-adenosylmethionine hydrolase